jgi:hypothetical protein
MTETDKEQAIRESAEAFSAAIEIWLREAAASPAVFQGMRLGERIDANRYCDT